MQREAAPLCEEPNPPFPKGIYLDHAIHQPVFRMSREHVHTCCELYYLRRGHCVYTVNQAQYHLEAGDLFLVAAGASHGTCYEGDGVCERIIVFFQPEHLLQELTQRYPEIRRILGVSCKVILNEPLRLAAEGVLDLLLQESNAPQHYSNEMLRLETTRLLLLLLREGIFSYEEMSPKEGYSSDIEKALKYIALHYMLPLTLAEVASACNLCPTYFSRKFKQITGITFKEHLNDIRLRQAARMLSTTGGSVTEIATACGFSSSNYFKDLFRKKTGLSPRAYRQQITQPVSLLRAPRRLPLPASE